MSEAGDGVAAAAEESVHDLRVAIARVRSALRTFGPALPTDTSLELGLRLKQCAAMLGPVRDLEVIGELLDSAPQGPHARPRGRGGPGRAGLATRARAVRGARVVAHARLVADLTSYVDGLATRKGDLRPLARRAAAPRRQALRRGRARPGSRCTAHGQRRSGRGMPRRSWASRSWPAGSSGGPRGSASTTTAHVAAARLLSIEVTGADADERDRILAHLAASCGGRSLAAIGSL